MKRDLVLALPQILKGTYVPFLSPFFDASEKRAIETYLTTNETEPYRTALEQKLVEFFGGEGRCLLFGSGRTALQALLQSLKLPANSEVVMPSFCCSSVASAILNAGLKPVFAGTDGEMNLSFKGVLEGTTPLTRVVIVPHLAGVFNQSLFQILDWSKDKNIFVIEDCAQSLGLRHGGQAAGTFADAAIFSTGLGKMLFTPGGGWIYTRNASILAEMENTVFPEEYKTAVLQRIARFLEDFGPYQDNRSWTFFQQRLRGFLKKRVPVTEQIFLMSQMEAKLVLIQMEKLPQILALRHANANRWLNWIRTLNLSGIHFSATPDRVFTKLLVWFDDPGQGLRFRDSLSANGVGIEDSYSPSAFCLPVRPNLTEKEWAIIERAMHHSSKRNRVPLVEQSV